MSCTSEAVQMLLLRMVNKRLSGPVRLLDYALMSAFTIALLCSGGRDGGSRLVYLFASRR